jgi:hypothetical protein
MKQVLPARREVRKNLEAYCCLDTLGMRDIVKAVLTISRH